MSTGLTKPLIVPEYNNAFVKLYKPVSGTPTADSTYTINAQTVLNTLVGAGRTAAPNACAILNDDLFVSLSSGDSQSIVKFPNYLVNPSASITNAFIFTLDGNDYVGMAFDKAGSLYTAEGSYGNNSVYKYTGTGGAYPGAANAGKDNYLTRTNIGNVGVTSYFGDLAFDTAGNLWAADYQNHRVVVFDAAGLSGGTYTYHVLNNLTGSIAVANTNASLNSATTHLFAEPEGIDFDAQGNMWVANNNDGGGSGGVQNSFTSLVKITPALQTQVLAAGAGGSVTPAAADANSKYFIYQVPASGAGRAQFGGLQIDRSAGRLFVNEEVAGNGRWYDIAAIAGITTNTATNDLAFVSTNPGNGGIALVNLGLYIVDDSPDTGFEPNTTTTIAWESPGISVTQNLAGGVLSSLPAYENVRGGNSCYVYVEVKNAGLIASTGTETLSLYWAKASAGLSWPVPWDGSVSDTSPYTGSKMGGSIGSPKTIAAIQPGGSAIIAVNWPVAPDPSQYNVQDGHFCILARIQTAAASPYGMTYPETADLSGNVLNNSKIAWRNIHIINPLTNMIVHFPNILLANYGETPMSVRLGFELLDAGAQPFQPAAGKFLINAKGAALEALEAAARDTRNIRYLGDGQFSLGDLEAGIGGLTLQPGERLELTAQYHPEEVPKGYAIRATQFAQGVVGEQIVGGQTFVFGEVKGFPVKQPKPKQALPSWLWLLLILILVLILFLLFLK